MGYVFSVNCPVKHFTLTTRVSEVTMTWVSSHTIYERDDIDVNLQGCTWYQLTLINHPPEIVLSLTHTHTYTHTHTLSLSVYIYMWN